MSPFDIFITNISWKGGSKKRPILVILINDKIISVYPITTQFKRKSSKIKAKYFKIIEWAQAGLDKQSYVDTVTRINLPIAVINKKHPIGKLTDADKQRFLEFLL